MNIPLLEHNIRQMESQIRAGSPEEACKTALALARLLLQSPGEASPRALYGAYAGVASSLQGCYSALLETNSPSEDIAQMARKIEAVNEEIARCAGESARVAGANKKLLDEEGELARRREKLHQLKLRVEQALCAREKELPALAEEIEAKKQKLRELEDACEAALREKARWMQAFEENERLIAALPDAGPDAGVDGAIAAAKEYARQARLADEQGDEWLRKVIEEVGRSRERMKSPGPV